MTPLPELLQKCRQQGLKLTPQRIAIFEALLLHPGHPSAEEIYEEVHGRFPTVSFATVYNTLQRLTEMGEVHEIVVHELRRRYDANSHPHQHAVCRECRRIVDVSLEGSEAMRQLASADLSGHGFSVETVAVEFTGLCDACRGGGAGPFAAG